MNEWERLARKAKMLKQRYPEGTVVQLGFMEGEPDMPAGLKLILTIQCGLFQPNANLCQG